MAIRADGANGKKAAAVNFYSIDCKSSLAADVFGVVCRGEANARLHLIKTSLEQFSS